MEKKSSLGATDLSAAKKKKKKDSMEKKSSLGATDLSAAKKKKKKELDGEEVQPRRDRPLRCQEEKEAAREEVRDPLSHRGLIAI